MDIEQTPLRAEIDGLFAAEEFDMIGNLPGFTIVERRNHAEDERNKIDCLYGAFNGNWEQARMWVWARERGMMLPEYQEVRTPEERSLIEYYRTSPQGETILHIGRVASKERIISKFDMSHVYEHPITAVPSGYGNRARFFSKK